MKKTKSRSLLFVRFPKHLNRANYITHSWKGKALNKKQSTASPSNHLKTQNAKYKKPDIMELSVCSKLPFQKK